MLSKLWDILNTYYEQDPEKVALFLKNVNHLKHLTPVYSDETRFDTYFYRKYGRSLRGQLIKGKVFGKRYQRISLVAGLINGDIIAPMIYEETMTSHFFEAWFQKFLLPTLGTPSVIIMDKVRFHRISRLELLCEEHGINFYLFHPTLLCTILLRKHGLISKSTSKKYCQITILFMKLFCPIPISIDYIVKREEAGKKFSKL